MPNSVLVSFRDQTTGRISDFLKDEGLNCAQSLDLLSYFAGELLSYEEEGIKLMPSIVLCNSISSFLNSFPGSVSHVIGQAPLADKSGPKILKDCAPLSGSSWFIFIERDEIDQIVKYGVFTYSRSPTTLPLHEGIGIDSAQFSVLIRKASSNTINIIGSKGNLLTMLFSTLRELTGSSQPISDFAKKCCSGISEDKYYDEFVLYFSRLLETALTACHGTILACGNELDYAANPTMQDAVNIAPKVDFFGLFKEFKIFSSADSILALQRSENLFKGFLRCDGIIVVDTYGCISAYRVFFRPVAAAGEPEEKIVGGARRRAFEGLKELVGTQLESILFRSQDGQTIHYGGE